MPATSLATRLARLVSALSLLLLLGTVGTPAGAPQSVPATPPVPSSSEPFDSSRPDFARMVRQQAETDRVWREASVGHMRMEKIVYRSRVGDLDIPAFVFQPIQVRGARQHPALIWVHENIRGHLYEHYIPYIREATARGFIVIAPEYRGSIGYGRKFYDAIDYGGAEVDDVVTAASVVTKYPGVDPAKIGIIGWSHGGLITLLSIFRNPTTFKAAVAMVPVTNLFQRLAQKGVDQQRRLIDPQNRFGGSPSERPTVYRDRSPLFQVDRLQIPLLVHVAHNDGDVSIDEVMPLLDALKARKADLADLKIYQLPPGGHLFDRLVMPITWEPIGTPDQEDSWERVWGFLDKHLRGLYN